MDKIFMLLSGSAHPESRKGRRENEQIMGETPDSSKSCSDDGYRVRHDSPSGFRRGNGWKNRGGVFVK